MRVLMDSFFLFPLELSKVKQSSPVCRHELFWNIPLPSLLGLPGVLQAFLSSVMSFSRKLLGASESTPELSHFFFPRLLLWLPLQSALCSIPKPFSVSEKQLFSHRDLLQVTKTIFGEGEGVAAEQGPPWHLENAHQPNPPLIPPLQFQYFHTPPSSEINAFALRTFVKVLISEEMPLDFVKIYSASVLQIFVTLE